MSQHQWTTPMCGNTLIYNERYRNYFPARTDLCRRLGPTAEARPSYQRALKLTQQEPERRFLERRLAELSG